MGTRGADLNANYVIDHREHSRLLISCTNTKCNSIYIYGLLYFTRIWSSLPMARESKAHFDCLAVFFCLLCTQYRTHGQVSCLLPCSHIRTTQGGRGDLADRTNMTSDGFIECTQDLTNLFSSVLEGLPLKMAKFISELYRAKKQLGVQAVVSNPFIDKAVVRGLLYEES